MEYLSEKIEVGSEIILKEEVSGLPNDAKVIRDYSYNGFFEVMSKEGDECSVTVYEVDNYYEQKC